MRTRSVRDTINLKGDAENASHYMHDLEFHFDVLLSIEPPNRGRLPHQEHVLAVIDRLEFMQGSLPGPQNDAHYA